jgi:antitoxin (DNA-binding transcriptional repressor) of toxin-antitoxin stability system
MIRDLRRRTHVFNAYRNPVTHKFGVEENISNLLDAIASGDQERARSAMAEHIESVKWRLSTACPARSAKQAAQGRAPRNVAMAGASLWRQVPSQTCSRARRWRLGVTRKCLPS